MSRTHPPSTRRKATYTDVGNADIAGANICHPWRLNTRSRPPRTVEVQVLQEQKPAMRVMVVDKCVRFTSLAVNGTAVILDSSHHTGNAFASSVITDPISSSRFVSHLTSCSNKALFFE